MREIRFFAGVPGNSPFPSGPTNPFAGTNDASAIGPYYSLRVIVDGPVDPRTGYLCDIKELEKVVRRQVDPLFPAAGGESRGVAESGRQLRKVMESVERECPAPARIASLRLALSPFTSLTIRRGETTMLELTQSYEFAASHRLYIEGLSDAENHRRFGKCSNPHGHGHNYVLDVTVKVDSDARVGSAINIGHLDRVVRERVLTDLDHRNLNVEVAAFKSLNPTVENIARVIWDRLHGSIENGRLARVRVWETSRTYAEFALSV